MNPFDIPKIMQGYAQGYFIMTDENGELGWYSSRERALIPLDERFRYPKSLRRVLNQDKFTVAIDRAFEEVCYGCANRETTWISPELIEIYLALNQAGWAHSFETWEGDELAGAILGITFGSAFIGESMFYRIPDGSKVAMVKLVEHLRSRNYLLFDAQMQNPHLERFGAYIIPEEEYYGLLQYAILQNNKFI